jgi:hypothetical protein
MLVCGSPVTPDELAAPTLGGDDGKAERVGDDRSGVGGSGTVEIERASRELPGHVAHLGDRHLGRRRGQGTSGQVPDTGSQGLPANTNRPIEVRSVLDGLHVDYRRAA